MARSGSLGNDANSEKEEQKRRKPKGDGPLVSVRTAHLAPATFTRMGAGSPLRHDEQLGLTYVTDNLNIRPKTGAHAHGFCARHHIHMVGKPIENTWGDRPVICRRPKQSPPCTAPRQPPPSSAHLSRTSQPVDALCQAARKFSHAALSRRVPKPKSPRKRPQPSLRLP